MYITFEEIYSKAVGLFDDPKITKAFETNKIQFAKLMYVYLQNSISLFNNPLFVATIISDYSEPNGTMEIFVSDGVTVTYSLDPDFKIVEDSSYVFIGDGERIKGNINKEDRTVTFSKSIEAGKEYSVEQYYMGRFNYNMEKIQGTLQTKNAIVNQIKDILARLLVKSWGENTRNFLLDIQNILIDSDFSVHSGSNALRAKDAWVNQLDTEILQYQNKLAWNIRMITGSWR